MVATIPATAATSEMAAMGTVALTAATTTVERTRILRDTRAATTQTAADTPADIDEIGSCEVSRLPKHPSKFPSHSANPTLLGSIEDLYLGKTCVREQLAMLIQGEQLHARLRRELFGEL